MADQHEPTPNTGKQDDRNPVLWLRATLRTILRKLWYAVGRWWRWLRKRWSWPRWRRASWAAKLGYVAAVLVTVALVAGLLAGLVALVWFFPHGVWRVVALEAAVVVVALVLADVLLLTKPSHPGPRWNTLMTLVGAGVLAVAGVAGWQAGSRSDLEPHRASSILLACGLALVVVMVIADRWESWAAGWTRRNGVVRPFADWSRGEQRRSHVVRAIVSLAVLAGLVWMFAVWPEKAPPAAAAAAVAGVVWGATGFLVGPAASWVWRLIVTAVLGAVTWLFAASDAGLLTLKLLASAAAALFAWRLASPLRLRDWRLTRAVGAGVVGVVVFARLDGLPDTDRGRVTLIVVVAVVVGLAVVVRKKPELLSLRQRAPHRSHADATRRHARELTSDGGALLVDAMDAEFGTTRPEACSSSDDCIERRVGLRSVHSHGTLAIGAFLPDADTAARLSAPLWRSRAIAALVRFSNFSGDPERNDGRKGVHGMALSLLPTAGDGIDLVLMDLDRFFARNREDFLAFTEAFGTRDVLRRLYRLTGLILFRRTTLPLVLKLIGLKHIASYLEPPYFGVNAFVWKIDGEDHHVRVEAVPMSDGSELKEPPTDPEYLHAELGQRLRGETFRSHRIDLVLGDGLGPSRLLDAMTPWPRSQDRIVLGHLQLFDRADDRYERMLFDPHRLPLGIRPSADEILMARRAAYAESHVRRTRAPECPARVSS